MSAPEKTRTLIAGPFNRVEGDLEIHLDVKDGRVSAARVNSPLFRGFERMLAGRPPSDALTLTPRICGICSISQSAAAALALAEAGGVTPAPDGARAAALMHGVENMVDHLTHFHLFFMPDFARPAYERRRWHGRAVESFTAQSGSALRGALEARAKILHIVGLLGGKWPHTLAIQPGGVTRAPGKRDLLRIKTLLTGFRRYLEGAVFGAPLEEFAAREAPGWERGSAGFFCEIAEDLGLADKGKGPGRYLSFGAYPLPEGPVFARGTMEGGVFTPLDTAMIAEDLSHAWMHGETAHPSEGQTAPDADMEPPGYSWCKAPRLAGRTMETGALARMAIDGHKLGLALAGEGGVRARVEARLLELARTQIALEELLEQINPEARFMDDNPPLKEGAGAGLVEAARGALGHWLEAKNGVITRYQIIAPTTWNFSPRDAEGVPGPVEAALEGAVVEEGEDAPLSVQHIVRSFDPCMVCTVH